MTRGRTLLLSAFIFGCGGAAEEIAGWSTTGADDGTPGSMAAAGDEPRLDVGPDGGLCAYLDLLFVIDNSESMATYQRGLAAAFPEFVTALFEALPLGVDVHVGLTTTDFDPGCGAAEAMANCQTAAGVDEVQSHYRPPTAGPAVGNGAQGRLFVWAERAYFALTTSDDPAPLTRWFRDAATAAGEDGCSFEMPVAAAGWAVHPANAMANTGFVRDEDALLVVFFLTDEPDKSPESKDVYAEMLRGAKAQCGGERCIFTAGLVPGCLAGVNQKLWQFMGLFADPVVAGDIADPSRYADVVGTTLAQAVARACARAG